MRTTLDDVTAAPLTRSVDGAHIEFAPLTVKGWGRLLRWMKSEIISLATEQLQSIGNERDKRIVMDQAYAAADKVTIFSLTETNSQLASLDGIVQVLYESARIAQLLHGAKQGGEDITPQWAELAVEQIEAAMELFQEIMQASGQSLQHLGVMTTKKKGAKKQAKKVTHRKR